MSNKCFGCGGEVKHRYIHQWSWLEWFGFEPVYKRLEYCVNATTADKLSRLFGNNGQHLYHFVGWSTYSDDGDSVKTLADWEREYAAK